MKKSEDKPEDIRRKILDDCLPEICDVYCRYPFRIKSSEKLASICAKCPTIIIEQYLEGLKDEG